jgi:hypothetical protein
MKTSEDVMAGMGVLAALIYIGIALGMLGLTIYGIYLAFCASIILGIIVFFTPPSGLIIGACQFLFGKDLAFIIVEFLTK